MATIPERDRCIFRNRSLVTQLTTRDLRLVQSENILHEGGRMFVRQLNRTGNDESNFLDEEVQRSMCVSKQRDVEFSDAGKYSAIVDPNLAGIEKFRERGIHRPFFRRCF